MPARHALLRQYETVSGEYLAATGVREVWRHIRELLEGAPNRRILDVGCFRGDFLDWLGPDWQRFGVEPSPDARRVAERRGITVLGATAEDLDASSGPYGAITLIDVLEHLAEPLRTLEHLFSLLSPNGLVVAFTGATDSLSWRIGGLDYWYSAIPDHVAFFSSRWFHWVAPRLNAGVTTLRRLPHRPAPLLFRLDEALKNVVFALYRRLARRAGLRKVLPHLPILGRVGRWSICWWTTATDHLLICMHKTPGELEAAHHTREEQGRGGARGRNNEC
jgi:SAM-dependent methyltransferase